MSQLRWRGATVHTQDDPGAYTNSFDVPARYGYQDAGSNLLTGELTYALGSNTILRANVSSYSETRETKDNWFGSD